MTLAPSPAYQARCSSGSASAQSPGGANPFGPPGPQLKSTQNARIASPASRPGLPVHKNRNAAHTTTPRSTLWRVDWRGFVQPSAVLGFLGTSLPGKGLNSAHFNSWSRERLMPLDTKGEDSGQALVPART